MQRANFHSKYKFKIKYNNYISEYDIQENHREVEFLTRESNLGQETFHRIDDLTDSSLAIFGHVTKCEEAVRETW